MHEEPRSTPTDYGRRFLVAVQTIETALAADESLAATARGDLEYAIEQILIDASDELRKDVLVYLSCTARYSGEGLDAGPLARKLRGRRQSTPKS